LVHGIGVASHYMLPTAEALTSHYAVQAPDLPGFGRSDAPSELLDVSGLAGALAAWIRELSLEPAAVLANSFGCQVAVDLAARFPTLAGSLVLVGPTVDRRARSWHGQLGRWIRNAPREPLSLGLVVARDYLTTWPLRIARTFNAALADAIEEKAPRVVLPTLVVRGSEDPIAPAEWVQELASRFPCGEVLELPGAAHTANYSHPEALAAATVRFLERAR
jgi:pimeloyl-ACP methyl ester carboxylesterase